MNKRILIVGCGPAGLIAAEICKKKGISPSEINIVSGKREQSKIGGAQFLHSSIIDKIMIDGEVVPNLRSWTTVDIVKVGSSSTYAEKIYGSSEVPTSWDDYEGRIPAWPLDKIYDELWKRWRSNIGSVNKLNPENFTTETEWSNYDQVFVTIPARDICRRPDIHYFPLVPIQISEFSDRVLPSNTIIYNGRLEDGWYRACNLFGHGFIEFGIKDVNRNQSNGYKPLGTNCDCWDYHNVTRIGRFGRWDRKVLLHHVPAQVEHALLS